MPSGIYDRKIKIYKEVKICPVCNNTFQIKKTSTKTYCCNNCKYRAKIGKKRTKETKEKMSISRKIWWNENKNTESVLKRNKKISNTTKNRSYEERYGVEKSLELKKVRSASKKGNKSNWFGKPSHNSGMTVEERYGIKKGKELREKNRQTSTGRIQSQKEKDKRAKSNTGKKRTKEVREKLSRIAKIYHNKPEVRKKHRIARLKQLKNNGNRWPSYNKNACEVFNKFDKINNTKGQYATSPYEYQTLGYSLDYYNKDLKLIIEVDEKHHFTKSGGLRKKDIIRQKQIEEVYPDYQFLRFKDSEMENILKLEIKK